MVTVIDTQFWARRKSELRFQPVQTGLAEFRLVFLDVSGMVFAAVDPFIEEGRQEVCVPLVFALILAEADIQAVVAAACRWMSAIRAVDNGQGFEVGNNHAVRISSGYLRLHNLLSRNDDASLCSVGAEFVGDAPGSIGYHIAETVDLLGVDDCHISPPGT